MTIASEITRLQNDKAAICTAIENKGVTVGAVTLDDYACCIDAIQQGGGGGSYCIDYLAVGGGAAGYLRDGGGGGDVCLGEGCQAIGPLDIKIGHGGKGHMTDACGGNITYQTCFYTYASYIDYQKGGDTIISNVARVKGGENVKYNICGVSANTPYLGGSSGSGCVKGHGRWGSGGGGAGGDGCNPTNCCYGGNGGAGVCGYGGGGGGYGQCSGGSGIGGGGNGASCGTRYCPQYADAKNCGGGGGGTSNTYSGNGGEGIVCICYPKDGSYGFDGATGGDCCFEEGDYCVHVFTKDGLFVPNTIEIPHIDYLVVGGGGSGGSGAACISSGGGGGEVCFGSAVLNSNQIDVVVGSGGLRNGAGDCVSNGGTSKLGNIVSAKGGCGPLYTLGGMSGAGWLGGSITLCCGGAGGGGAGGGGGNGNTICSCLCGYGGCGGVGCCGYGGGGGAGFRCVPAGYTGGCAVDGGGAGATSCNYAGCNATNCGGGGGGAVRFSGGKGGGGVVDICYACDGSYGINSATGGDSCYLCGNMCVHRFTSNGTFTIVS